MLVDEKRFHRDQELDDFWSGKVNYARGVLADSKNHISKNTKSEKRLNLKYNESIMFGFSDNKSKKARRLSRKF